MADNNNSWSNGPNGPKGHGKPGKGVSLAKSQGKKRYSRKRISSKYGGGK